MIIAAGRIERLGKTVTKTLIGRKCASQDVANKLFDMGVLFGVGTAVQNLQHALDLTPDGNFGPGTLAKLNASNASLTLQAFRENLREHATNVAHARPEEAVFLPDWIRRINS